MKLRKPGPEPIHDWPKLHEDWEASPLSLKKWTEEKQISYTMASREFAAIDREITQEAIAKTQMLLAGSLPDFARGLIALSQDEDKAIKLKAIIGGLDRSGFSPQAINVQVTNNATVNVLSIPIFASTAEPLMNRFLGAKNADTESDS